MKDLIILGTGVHGAEMAQIVERVNAQRPTWNFLGFISAKETSSGASHGGYPILGTLDRLHEFADAAMVPDNEFPRQLLPPMEKLVSLVDPSCFVSRAARIGAGCVLFPHCYVGLNAALGDVVFALAGCTINHDDVIGDRVVLASGTTLAGFVHVEADSYLGQSCTIRQYLRIGSRSQIGMGAVVLKDVSPNSVMVGNPARRVRDRFPAAG